MYVVGGLARFFVCAHFALEMMRSARRSRKARAVQRNIDLSAGFATVEAMKHVSLYRNSRLAIILFATAPLIAWGNAAMAMTLNSPAFQQNGHIPSKYTCEGEDVSPPLAWEGVPNGAKSLVLIIDDPDAPDPKAPKMV